MLTEPSCSQCYRLIGDSAPFLRPLQRGARPFPCCARPCTISLTIHHMPYCAHMGTYNTGARPCSWARQAAGYCDQRRKMSSFGNFTLHTLRMVFQRLETWAAMSLR